MSDDKATDLMNFCEEVFSLLPEVIEAWEPIRKSAVRIARMLKIALNGRAAFLRHERYARIQRRIAERGPRRRKHDGRWAKLRRR